MTGRPPSVSAEEVVRVIALHPEPVVTAKDVNEELGLTPTGALERMKRLVEQGYLARKDVGSSAVVFYLTDAGRRLLNDAITE